MANVFERGGRWYYRFFHNGRVFRGSAGAEATKKMADDLLKKKIREVTSAEINGPQVAPVTFAEFADDFLRTDNPQKKSKDRDQIMVATFKKHWPGKRLDEITTKMIADFKVERLEYRKPATVVRELQVLKRLFKMARNPVPHPVTAPNIEPEVDGIGLTGRRMQLVSPMLRSFISLRSAALPAASPC